MLDQLNIPKVHYNVAKTLSGSGRNEAAKLGYQRALRLHPDYEQAMNNLVRCCHLVSNLVTT